MELTNAIVCNTPFQLLNAINIVVNNVESGRYDLYLYGEFRNSEKIFSNLKKSKIFRNIYFIKKKKCRTDKIHILAKLIFPSILIKDLVFEDSSFTEFKSFYSNIFVGDCDFIGIYLHKRNPKANIIMFDDGISTNVGNALYDCNGILYKILGGIFKLGVYSYKIKKLYVCNKNFCKSTVTTEIIQLPLIDTNNKALRIIKNIFCYKPNIYIQKKELIYLGQPLNEKKGYNGKNPLFFLENIPMLTEKLVVRLHPRQDDTDFEQITIDNVNNIWELECMDSITDNHVLIGFCSTAHLMPKLLCDKEPYIIFLYELFLNDKNTKEYENDCSIVETIKEFYRNKEKILVPKTVQELIDFFS